MSIISRLAWSPGLAGRAGTDGSSTPDKRDERLPYDLTIRLALLAFTALLPTIAIKFVGGDDSVNFLENQEFRGLGWEQLRWAWGSTLVGVYQPVAWMLLEAQYALWGLNPRGYHVVSLTLHALDTVVLFTLTVTLIQRCRPDLCAAERRLMYQTTAIAVALYSVHPWRAEVTSWASCQPYLPCALFSMLSVLAYLHAQDGARSRRSSWAWVGVSFVLYITAVMCKAPAVCLPAILLILDVYPLRRLGGRSNLRAGWLSREAIAVWAEKVPFAAVALTMMIVAVVARESLSASIVHPLSFRIAQACYAAVLYLFKTIVPVGITAFYPFPTHPSWTQPRFVLSIAFVAVASIALFRLRHRLPGLLAAWAAYLVILAPTSGLVPMGRAMVADRYTYLAMMVWVAPTAAGLTLLIRRADRAWRVVSFAAAVPVVLGLSVASWFQCATWSSAEAIWTNALEHGGQDSSDVHNGLALAYAQSGMFSDAEVHFKKAVAINPDQASVQNNLGLLLCDLGKLNEAVPHLLEAIRLKPNFAPAYNNLGIVFSRKGKSKDSEFFYRTALVMKPRSPEFRGNLGVALLDQGRFAEAAIEFQAALKLRPQDKRAQSGLQRARAGTDDSHIAPNASHKPTAL